MVYNKYPVKIPSKLLPIQSLPKRAVKKIVRPYANHIIQAAHIKVFDKPIFINKYSRRIPVVDKMANIMNSKMMIAKSFHDREMEYREWFKCNYPKPEDLKRQRKSQKNFPERPLVSVIVPTYNTNPRLLRECIESVTEQTYDNWQLCLADDASTKPEVKKVIREFASKDDRIKFVLRKKNGHICRASNSALKLADGEFIALLDHDDLLWPNALFKVIEAHNKDNKIDFFYSDEDKINEAGDLHSEPFFKPDWSPEYLRSVNYITHFSVIRKKIVEQVGGFRIGYEGAQDWDLFLRVSRETDKIYHIPTVIYSWRKSSTSTAESPSAKSYAYVNQQKAILDDVKQRGMEADVAWQIPLSMWRVRYRLKTDPLVSVIIPTKDQYDYIERCLRSMHEKTAYENIEVIVVDTGSTDERVWELYKDYKQKFSNMRVVEWTATFNFAAVCDYGAEKAKGKYYLFLNNDTEVITPSWIEDMLGYAQQKEIGAVGCKLLYPDGRLQHGGIILGVGGQHGTPGIAGHFFPAFIDNPPQDPAQQLYVGGTRNFTAVTAACVMVEKDKFNSVDGFDPVFQIAFNDVDFCLKLHDKGLRNVYLPHVQLYHYESVSVGQPGSKQRDISVFAREIQLMLHKWQPLIEKDPFYHPEFRKDIASARLDIEVNC